MVLWLDPLGGVLVRSHSQRCSFWKSIVFNGDISSYRIWVLRDITCTWLCWERRLQSMHIFVQKWDIEFQSWVKKVAWCRSCFRWQRSSKAEVRLSSKFTTAWWQVARHTFLDVDEGSMPWWDVVSLYGGLQTVLESFLILPTLRTSN